MKCIKCGLNINVVELGYDYVLNDIDIVCVDCYKLDTNKDRENTREYISKLFEKEIDDYIMFMGEDRIKMMLLNIDDTYLGYIFNDRFKGATKKLFDIDYEDVVSNGQEWLKSTIREKEIDKVLKD